MNTFGLFAAFLLSSNLVFAQTNESTTTVETVTEEAVPRKLSFEFETWNYVNVKGMNENKADATSLTSFKFIYSLTPSSSLSLVPMAQNGWGVNKNGKAEFTMLDPYIQYAVTEVATLPGDIKLNTALRGYAGTSEESRARGQTAALRGNIELVRELGRGFNLSYLAFPYVYSNSKDYYLNRDEEDAANYNFRFWHYLELSREISDKWSFYSDLGLDQIFYRNTPEEVSNKPKQYLYAESGIAYAFHKALKVTGGLSSYWDRDLLAQENDFAVYRDDEMSYFMALNLYF